jgi:hypothetical protein
MNRVLRRASSPLWRTSPPSSLILVDDEINLPVLLLWSGVCPRLANVHGSSDCQSTITEANNMSGIERGGQHSKNESGDQAVQNAPKTPRSRGLNALLDSVRQKMAYTIRGI